MKQSHSSYLEIRGLRYHVRSWGPPEVPPVIFLHGWMDASASFQFVADALKAERRILAPDWRGEGRAGPGDTSAPPASENSARAPGRVAPGASGQTTPDVAPPRRRQHP